MAQQYPQTFQDLNTLSTKELNVIVEIEDSPYFFSLVPSYKAIKYGDDDLNYGDPGIVYGGLKQIPNVLPILSIDSNFVISQKVEPEQGRASAMTFSLTFLDLDGIMSKFISPGQTLNELLGGKEVKLWLGYANSSFRKDYFVFFRGYVTSSQAVATKIVLQVTDGNFKRRQQTFFLNKTKITTAINNSQTVIPLEKTSNLVLPILGPNGTYDPSLKTCLRIDDEIMTYNAGAISGLNITVTRGQEGTTAAAHDIDAEVSNVVFLEGNIVDLALKLMLSGWNGPYKTGVEVEAFVDTGSTLGNISNAIILPNGVDAVIDYGLAAGDYITVSGSTSNDGTYIVDSFFAINENPNKGILLTTNVVLENPTSGVMSFRSQYDTFPEACGSKLRPVDVDVARFQENRNLFFTQDDNDFKLYIDSPQSGKDLIEKELFLPVGAYSVTRWGQISMAVTKPPIADNRSTVLDNTNVVDPQSISITRALNNRRFFNEIQFFYDYDIDGNYKSVNDILDTVSLNETLKTSSPLPIQARGLRTALGAESLIARRGNYLLKRFKDAAYEIILKVNFQASSLIEVSDVVALYDNGNLHITNLQNGTRDLGAQLFEVIEKSMDLKTGVSTLRLLSSLGFAITDRFAGISPCSLIDVGSTTTSIRIKESFGNSTPNTEINKWNDFVGSSIVVRSSDYSVSSTSVIVGFDPSDNYKLLLNPPLAFTPPADYIVDVADYPNSTNQADEQALKLFFTYISPSLPVVSGISTNHFTLSSTDASRVVPGQYVLIRNADFSVISSEVTVDSVLGVNVFLSDAIAFIPSAGQFVELVGYPDGGAAYRIL